MTLARLPSDNPLESLDLDLSWNEEIGVRSSPPPPAPTRPAPAPARSIPPEAVDRKATAPGRFVPPPPSDPPPLGEPLLIEHARDRMPLVLPPGLADARAAHPPTPAPPAPPAEPRGFVAAHVPATSRGVAPAPSLEFARTEIGPRRSASDPETKRGLDDRGDPGAAAAPRARHDEPDTRKSPFDRGELDAMLSPFTHDAPDTTQSPFAYDAPDTTQSPFAHEEPATTKSPRAHEAPAPHASPRAHEAPDTKTALRDRFDVGDFSGALIVAEAILAADPSDTEAARYAEKCRTTLQAMYLARLGGLARVPMVTVPRDQIRWLSLDHRAGFLLSLVDGRTSLEDILDMSGMPALDAMRIVFELAQQNVIGVTGK